MQTYRVYFKRTVEQELYLDVQAETKNQARDLANAMVEDGDDMLTEIPESYDYDLSPTGEINEVDSQGYDK